MEASVDRKNCPGNARRGGDPPCGSRTASIQMPSPAAAGKIRLIMNEPGPTPAAAPPDARRFSRPSRALKVLLMEGIHENAVQVLRDAGFENVETHATALSEDALMERLRDAHQKRCRGR